MKLLHNHRVMRVPPATNCKTEGTAIVDENNKLVAYSRGIISIHDKNPVWDFVRKDNKA